MDDKSTELKEETTSADTAPSKKNDEVITNTENTAPPASEDKPDESPIDYKALFEEEQARRVGAERKIVDLKRNKEPDSEEIAFDDDSVDQKIDKKAEEIRKDLASDLIEDSLLSSSENPDERKLIRFHYENTIRPTGFSKAAIQSDIAKAKALANAPKLERKLDEIKKARQAEKTIGKGEGGTSVKKSEPAKQIGEIPAATMRFIESRAKREGISTKQYIINNHPEYLV